MNTKEIAEFGEHFVDEILDTVETPIALLDDDGKILRFNHACETLTEYSENEAVGRKVWEFLIIEAEIESVRKVFTKTRSEDLPTHFTNYWKTKSGERRLLRWSNKTLRRSDGGVIGILATALDITDLTQTEQRLSESQAFLRSIIDASPIAIITIDERGKILTFSAAARTTFGYRYSEVIGKNVNLLMSAPENEQHDEYIRRYLETGKQRIIGNVRRVKAKRKNGEAFPAMLHVSEFRDGDHIFVGFVEDISDKEETERRLSETQSQLQHAGRVGAMGEIATSIAHELNQPLTAAASLVGAVSLRLKKGECAECEDSLPLLDDAVGEIRRASDIIQQMREFVRKQKTAKSLHDVNKIVQDAGALAIIGADADGVEVKWDLATNIGEMLLDRVQIQQVVTNLIRNAIDAMKDMPKRILTISTVACESGVEVSVADTGSGLDEKTKTKLFEPFVTSKQDGLGVGLSISKAIIDAHQGKIFATDRESGGCVFTFKLPTGAGDEVGEK